MSSTVLAFACHPGVITIVPPFMLKCVYLRLAAKYYGHLTSKHTRVKGGRLMMLPISFLQARRPFTGEVRRNFMAEKVACKIKATFE